MEEFETAAAARRSGTALSRTHPQACPVHAHPRPVIAEVNVDVMRSCLCLPPQMTMLSPTTGRCPHLRPGAPQPRRTDFPTCTPARAEQAETPAVIQRHESEPWQPPKRMAYSPRVRHEGVKPARDRPLTVLPAATGTLATDNWIGSTGRGSSRLEMSKVEVRRVCAPQHPSEDGYLVHTDARRHVRILRQRVRALYSRLHPAQGLVVVNPQRVGVGKPLLLGPSVQEQYVQATVQAAWFDR